MNQKVLEKLLKANSSSTELLKPKPNNPKNSGKPGRPKVPATLKARNFTLCLAPEYLSFLDRMVVKDSKIQGRGRKIRFIMDRFMEHEKRSLHQMKVLRQALTDVQKVIQAFGSRVKIGQKLELSIREKAEISQVVKQVHTLMKLLGYSPKVLQRMLPSGEWAILSFCLNWNQNRGVVL